MPSHAAPIQDLYSLTLVDGLPATTEGREIRYKQVRLRDTNVADERWAQRQAERVVPVGGKPTLLVSDADFRFALTARHVESLRCDGQTISQALIGDGWLDVLGKLSAHDLGLIEQRIFLITLAGEVRYGHMTEADFQAIAAGDKPMEGQGAPQRRGQAAELGQAADESGPGPAMLADYAGDAAHGTPALDGR
jgi:phage FluMu protein gp41